MKFTLMVVVTFLSFFINYGAVKAGNNDISGIYDYGSLIIAYNKENGLVSGYYENHTGWDERTNSSRFACIFYFEGERASNSNLIRIKSWYPDEFPSEGSIYGDFKISDDGKLLIKLDEDHGGCGNVQHFSGEFVDFSLEELKDWIAIRFVKSDKAHFYKNPNEKDVMKAYVIRGDVLKVLKIEGEWLYIEYHNLDSGKISKAWVKDGDLY